MIRLVLLQAVQMVASGLCIGFGAALGVALVFFAYTQTVS